MREAVYPLAFSVAAHRDPRRQAGHDLYLNEPTIRKLVEFFENKGLAAIKQEDQHEQWYNDWLAYQDRHELYARLLSPKRYSARGFEFDLLRYTRFLEVFAYFSPAHGYSLQVTFLGLFPILMGSNEGLKQEAVGRLERGGLFALGVSERNHGADLLANEFTVTEVAPGRFTANGTKYYIGNSNCASIVSILARKEDERSAGRARRAPIVLFALRPSQAPAFRSVRKIGTLGVRAAFVGEFEVKEHELPAGDLIAEGRHAWDAFFGTVTLGKFFLGFGSIGICEHAFEEAVAHLSSRVLYGKPVIEMPHIRATLAQAYARLTAMKLYAYRALDYVQAARVEDRRYLLFAAVQKAKVSTEGVKVMALLSECVGAKGFESDTYFEMALRDVQLIPGLEGSTHINLGLTAQFIPRYFAEFDPNLHQPQSLVADGVRPGENTYLMEARTGAVNTIAFPHFLEAYRPLRSISNVRSFVKQVKAFQLLVRRADPKKESDADTERTLLMGQCLSTIAYAQLVAENSALLEMPSEVVSTMFHWLVHDFSVAALALASSAEPAPFGGLGRHRMVCAPAIRAAEWDFVSARAAGTGGRDAD